MGQDPTGAGDFDLAELMQPVLGEQDDLAGLDRPWSPWTLVFVTFFAGPVGGGLLFGLNFKRIGRPHALWPCVLGGLVLQCVLAALFAWLLLNGTLDPGDPQSRGWGRRGSQAVTVLAGMGLAAMQQRRFRLFEASGGESPRLWPYGLGAIVLGMVAGMLIVGAVLNAAAVPLGAGG